MRVVICEDDPIMRRVLSHLVTEAGHEVIAEADRGYETIQILAHTHPDLLITDLMIPGSDNLLRDLDVPGRTYPIIVFSAIADQLRTGPGIIAVQKPDFERLRTELDNQARAGDTGQPEKAPVERRRSAPRPVVGGSRTSPWEDPAAFYAGLGEAKPGETLVFVSVSDPSRVDALGQHCRNVIRTYDSMLRQSDHLILLLCTTDPTGADIAVDRLRAGWPQPEELTFAKRVVQAGEVPADAFTDLRRSVGD